MLLSGPVRSQFIPLHWRGEPFDPTPNHVSPTRPCLTKGETLEALGPFAGGPIGLGHPPSGTLMSMQASVWGKTRMWSSGDRLVLGYIKRPTLRGVPGRSSSSQREAFTGEVRSSMLSTPSHGGVPDEAVTWPVDHAHDPRGLLGTKAQRTRLVGRWHHQGCARWQVLLVPLDAHTTFSQAGQPALVARELQREHGSRLHVRVGEQPDVSIHSKR